MKHIIRLFVLIAALVVGTNHAWADITPNPRVKFVYVDEDNYSSESEKGFAFASSGETTGPLTIAVDIYNGQDYRCIEGDLTAEQSINSGMGQARRRAPGKGVPVPLLYSKTNEFTLTLPEDESTNVTVYVKFSPKLEFTPEVSIEGWTYGDEAKTPTITGNTSGGAVTYTYSDTKDGTYTETVPTQAGPHWVKASVAATADYKACESEPVEFTISKAPLTVTANDHSIYYGNAVANNGVEYSDFVNNEDESVLEGPLTYTYSNNKGPYGEGNDAPGFYEIKPGGLDSKNYEITFVSGTLFVKPARVSVRVVDKADGEGIKTAYVTVQVLDNGNQVTVCQIGWSADINDLKAGKTYTLRETVAPEGYVLPSDLTFTIDNEGKITSSGSTTTDEFGNTVLLLENSKTRVEVSVVDITTKAPISGAPVQVLDGNGNVVKDLENNDVEWTSNGSTHTIEGLKTGVTYTLHETIAPEGYTISTAITFTIGEDGNVTSSGSVTEDGVLLVENAMTHVKISVVDIANGDEIEGAHVQVTDSEGNVADEWDSTTENHIVEGLKTGEEYTLRETVAPEGYTISTAITFTIGEDGNVTSTGTITEDGVLLVENAFTVPLFAAGATSQWMTWCDKNAYTKPEGVTVYTVSSVAKDGKSVTLSALTDDDVIPAYTPVLLYRSTVGTDAVTAAFSAVGTAPTDYDEEIGICSSVNSSFTFFGTTKALETIPVDGNFTYYNGGLTYVLYGDKFLKSDSNNGIAANRCWLKLDAEGGTGDVNARQLVIVVDDETTAVESEKVTVNSEKFAAATVWYTIDGRKLSGKPTKKGLYIYNGKKTVVK